MSAANMVLGTWCTLLLMAVILGILVQGDLENPFHYKNKAFQFHEEPKVQWTTSKRNCEISGGNLVTITDKDTQKFLEEIFNKNKPSKKKYFIGAYRNVPGNWSWVTGLPVLYSNWAPKPSKKYAYYSLYKKTKHKWLKMISTGYASYICQYDCHQGVQYEFVATKLNWTEAQEACHNKNSTLLIIPDRSTLDYIEKTVKELKWPDRDLIFVHVGAKKIGTDWTWTNGLAVTYPNMSKGVVPRSQTNAVLSLQDFSLDTCDEKERHPYICVNDLSMFHRRSVFHCGQIRFELFSNKTPMNEARKDCITRGGRLLEISDSQTEKMIEEFMIQHSDVMSNMTLFWLGMTWDKDDAWTWLSGNYISNAKWKPEPEPNHQFRCAVLNTTDFSWRALTDCGLSFIFPYICQYDQKTTIRNYNKLQLHFIEKPKNWTAAHTDCKQQLGNLISISDNRTMESIQTTLKLLDWRNKTTYVWVGNLSKYVRDLSTLNTATALHMVENKIVYLDEELIQHGFYICQFGSFVCPSPVDMWLHNRTYYHLIRNSTSWLKAEPRCISKGGHLLTITHNDIQTFLKDKLLSIKWDDAKENDLLIHTGARKKTGGWWKWSDTGDNVTYNNWQENELHDQYYAMVAMLNITSRDMTWVKRGTGVQAFFICQYDVKDQETHSRCPGLDNTFLYKDRIFRVFTDKQTWNDSQLHCRSFGGHLVTVPDGDTQMFLVNVLKTIPVIMPLWWIGARRDTEWTWESDDDFKFHLWDSDEFDHDDSALCGAIYTNDCKWSTKPCDSILQLPYICQSDAVVVERQDHEKISQSETTDNSVRDLEGNNPNSNVVGLWTGTIIGGAVLVAAALTVFVVIRKARKRQREIKDDFVMDKTRGDTQVSTPCGDPSLRASTTKVTDHSAVKYDMTAEDTDVQYVNVDTIRYEPAKSRKFPGDQDCTTPRSSCSNKRDDEEDTPVMTENEIYMSYSDNNASGTENQSGISPQMCSEQDVTSVTGDDQRDSTIKSEKKGYYENLAIEKEHMDNSPVLGGQNDKEYSSASLMDGNDNANRNEISAPMDCSHMSNKQLNPDMNNENQSESKRKNYRLQKSFHVISSDTTANEPTMTENENYISFVDIDSQIATECNDAHVMTENDLYVPFDEEICDD